MKIFINNKEVAAIDGETILEAARRQGHDIPAMCYAPDAVHKSSCMVCVVRNCANGQLIPSCSTLVTDGMQIETENEEITLARTLSLELLLSDHRADCEAPCRIACPGGLDVAMMNRLYDEGKYTQAVNLLRDTLVIPATLCYICNAPCEKVCRKNDLSTHVPIREIKKALVGKSRSMPIEPTERNGHKVAVIGSGTAALSAAYRLSKLGYQVTIFEALPRALSPHIDANAVPTETIELELSLIQKTGIEIIESCPNPTLDDFDGVVDTMGETSHRKQVVLTAKTKQPARLVLEGRKLADDLHAMFASSTDNITTGNKLFNSTYSRFNNKEKEWLTQQLAAAPPESGCLYCDCDKKEDCKLRSYATDYNIKTPRYTRDNDALAMKRQKVSASIWFESSKCIKCGLCVYNSNNGFTFQDRGFVMTTTLPNESATHIHEKLVTLCPTGALYMRK